MSTELVQLKNTIALQTAEFHKALPPHVDTEKFVRVLQTAVSVNQNLIAADRASLFASAQRAAAMGLLPDGREGAIVEFGKQCQFMPMVAGLLRLARQSGQISTLDAIMVCKNDKFTYRPGLDAVPLHEPDWFGDRGEYIGVYAVCHLKDGGTMVEIMSIKDLEKIRATSRSKNGPAWSNWFDQMAIKSVLRRLSKRLPSSTDIDSDARLAEALADEYTESPAPAAPSPEPRKPGRPTRLQAVVDSAPPADVIDAEPTAPAVDTDSPI